jgi:phosphatidylserine/phosphatidylglycerophosphate/cardiolipin synthase-like enzyme
LIRLIVLTLFLSTPLFSQEAPSLRRVESFEKLSKYLDYYSQGAIRPTRSSELSFVINQSTKTATPVIPDTDPDLIHSLFETDVRKFVENLGTDDFVSAKKKFYQTQTFYSRDQKFSRPYVYLSDWRSLFHSPIRKINLPLDVYGKQFTALDDASIQQSPLLDVSLHRRLDYLTDTEMTAGNKLRLLNNGQISFKEKLRMVKEAKKFFHSVVMVQYCDETGSEIVNAMIAKAKAGVDVRLVLESAWTRLVLSKCLKKLTDGGVKVSLSKGFFDPKTMFSVHHTKFWIRDGEEAIIGGQNMHDFENTSNGFNRKTRDKDVHITEGPAVTDLMRAYVRVWNQSLNKPDSAMEPYMSMVVQKEQQEREQGLRGKQFYEGWLGLPPSEIPGLCRVLVQGTKTTSNSGIIPMAYLEILKNVKYGMFINTPTLRYKESKFNEVYNSRIVKAILDGAARGVKVDMVSNGADGGWGEAGYQIRDFANQLRSEGKFALAFVVEQIDHTVGIFIGRGNRKHLADMLKYPNVDAWQYFNHIHSKQMLWDQIMTSTGSFNLDKHSHKNHESTMICLDKKLADESLTGFVSDIINSAPVL